ncbi:hypothetical protein [Microbacterium candidum]|uniref:Integral membrane protein n=1 Tax=Microbacterium candidum TaxID=3041922 RepID=A0ABT7N1F3_9MICO|nr:hypothetical protein [Microbacterium sp. ASV49]MDL9980539.1 hypothetical protein [Microbacterium sp. ASV49]
MADTIAEPSAADPTEAESSTSDLEKRIAELEAENARLASGSGAGDEVPPTKKKPKGGGWRAFVSALCIVIAAILVPVSIVAAWARTELVNEDAFVSTLAPLAEDPHVQSLIIDEAMTAIESKVDFNQLTGNVIDGLTGLGLGPRASQALKMLQQPAADGLQNLVETGVTKVVQSPAFADVWATAVRGAHRALVTTATSDGNGVFVLTDQGLGMKLGPIIEQVKQKLIDSGVGVASLIPAIDKTIIIGDGSAVGTIRTVYAIADTAGWWLPLISLGLFLLGILIARRRSTAVLGAGVGLFLGSAMLASTFSVGTLVVGQAASQLKVSVSGLDVIYSALVDSMQHTAQIGVLLGALIAVIGWLTGRWSPARRLRGIVGGLNASARSALAARGVDTGRFGEWMGRQRILARSILVVLAFVWLFALRPLSGGDIFLVVIVTLLVMWALELLQKRPGDAQRAIAAARGDEGELVAPGGTILAADGVALEAASSSGAGSAASDAEAGQVSAEVAGESSDDDNDTAEIPSPDATDTAEIPDAPAPGRPRKK